MYKMIKLNYSFDSFEPIISKETMQLHYEKLYKGYVDNYNKVLNELMSVRNSNDFSNIKSLEKNLSFQGSGAVLHSLFFENLTPSNNAIPKPLLAKIENDFGTIEQFKAQFIANISNIEGSGWGILGYLPDMNKLVIMQCEKHQNLTIWGIIPILVIDIWEHAYYLDYQADKKKYAESIYNFINWIEVYKRYLNK